MNELTLTPMKIHSLIPIYLLMTLLNNDVNILVHQGGHIWHPNWVKLVPNETHLGLFKIIFSTFWLGEPKCTETGL